MAKRRQSVERCTSILDYVERRRASSTIRRGEALGARGSEALERLGNVGFVYLMRHLRFLIKMLVRILRCGVNEPLQHFLFTKEALSNLLDDLVLLVVLSNAFVLGFQ